MGAIKKNLVILTDYADLVCMDSSLLEQCDKVAFMPGVMLAFEEKGIPYLTFDDFYGYKQFRADNLDLMDSAEEMFAALDRKYEPFLNFPYAFTGNIYWFLIFFADIRYISMVCDQINKVYDTVYVVSDPACRSLSESEIGLEFSPEGLNLNGFFNSVDHKINMLKACLGGKYVGLDAVNCRQNSSGIDKGQLIRRAKDSVKRALSKIYLSNREKTYSGERTIFLIQGGYEAGSLKEYMREFLFINPVEDILQAIRNKAGLNISELFHEELDHFVNRWIPNFKKYVFEIFNLYHKNVICSLNSFSESMDKALDIYKPEALLYSISSNMVHENLCAYLAKQKNIPVFYFQHGGTNIFVDHPYQKYFERNPNIAKINILQSKTEQSLLGKSVFPEGRTLGSIKLFDLYSKFSIRGGGLKKEILYCPGAFNFAYKEIMVNCPDVEIFEVNKNIISMAKDFGLKMDIKVSPDNESYNCAYFARLLKNLDCQDFCVIKGIAAENIIGNYGLLILDYVCTALFSVSAVLNVPVIIYLKDSSYLRQDIICDMEKIYYLARDRSDLKRYIDMYAGGKLASKFSLDFIDKYAFPVNSGSPGPHIAEYIRDKIVGKNRKPDLLPV